MADSTDLAEEADLPEGGPDGSGAVAPPRRRALRMIGATTGVVLVVALAGTWLARERIADNLISGQLRQMGLPATYRIKSIGARSEVLRDVVIGDPAHPDMTIEQIDVTLAYQLGTVGVESIKLVGPRVYGRYHNGRLSFGALDKVLFEGKPTAPFRLPDLDVTVVDGRGRIDTDFGRVGLTAAGAGRLRDGFSGSMAAAAPRLIAAGCDVRDTNAVGRIGVVGERLRFTGPVRLDALRCAGLGMEQATLDLDATGDKDFGGVTTKAKLRSGAIAAGNAGVESLALDGDVAYRGGALSGRVAGNAGGVHAPGVSVALLGLDGLVRARDGFRRVEFRGEIDGQGLRRGEAFDRALANAQTGAAGTLLAPMMAQVRAALGREERGSGLNGELSWRQAPGAWSLVMPQATLRGGSGQVLLALSKFQMAGGDAKATPHLAGSFSTGGVGLPKITGRMERAAAGGALFRLAMAEYRAGGGALAVPDLLVAQVPDGSIGFSGMARLSGAIPGGSVTNLMLPVHGALGSRGELALYRRCITPRFDMLRLGEMVLDGRSVTVCPPGGGTIVRQGAGGLHVAAGLTALALTGRFGATPMRVQTGAVGFAWPGVLSAKAVDVALGPPDNAARFRLSDLTAKLGGEFAGTFDGVEARLAAVPLDVTNAAGSWRYAGQKLALSGVHFDLTDRMNPARFEKLVARDASLSLFNSRIEAEALLRAPESDRAVARAAVRHDLGSGVGHADLAVDGLKFDKVLQPDALTRLALGVVANVDGTVRGAGKIDWTERGVTSTGRFGTEGMDLAAAFGPVKKLSGTLEFTDLLNMVTAPNQTFRVASVNPGIEVNDGVVELSLLPQQVLKLEKASWPFLGGMLSLEPTELRMGIAEPRHYTLTIVGLDAAKFVERMQLGNLSATGTFDGQLPLVFDANGGRIVGGNLLSRAPGGNVSYVGALTYKDLSPMANFAFEALRSLDYRTMTIGIRGDLEGEVVTNVKFDGVKQGTGTKRNFVTRQIGNLPIQFNVNIRAPFYQLITSVKAMYDPAFIKDPRTLGLVDDKGRPVRRYSNGVRPEGTPVIVLPTIQPPESGNRP